MTKVGLSISNIKRLPSGRGMAAIFNGTWIINIYAPSGAEKKTERERFYTNDLTYILPTKHTEMIFAGDFNCILDTVDSTGHKNFSRALSSIVSGYRLHDVWDASRSRHGYTHYAPRTASRLDRIYVTQILLSRKQGVETIAAAFTDHLAVVLRLAIETPIPSAGRGYWRMNVSYLHDKTFREDLTTRWAQWKKHKKFYPNCVLWWGRYVKRMVRQLFTSEGTNRRRDRKTLENFYYDAIYNILQDATLTDTTYVTLKKLKAKIVRLHHEPTQRLLLHTEDQDKCEDETPSLYHILQMRKRQESRMIDRVYDSEGHLKTSPLAILRVYTEFMKNKYDMITADADSIHRILRHSCSKMPLIANEALDTPITMEEMHIAVKQGKN